MSEFTLIIGNKNYSSWSLRPWLWMKQIDIEFEEVVVALFEDDYEAKLAEYFSNQKVPLLIHGGFEVWDSLAICEYLSDLYPQQTLLLKDAKQRAVMRALCAEMHSSFVALRSELPMNCRRQPSPLMLSDACLADIQRIQALWLHAANYSNGEGDYLFGSFSMADAMFAPVVFRLHSYQVELESGARDYVAHMLQHPAMLEWTEAARREKQIIESSER